MGTKKQKNDTSDQALSQAHLHSFLHLQDLFPTPTHTPYTLPPSLPRDTPLFQRRARSNNCISHHKTQQSKRKWGRKRNMSPITSLLNTTCHRLPLCFLYPSHPRAFPNQHSFPSNYPPPPSHTSNTNTTTRQEQKRCLKAFDELFCSILPLFLLVVTIYHWIEKFFSIKTHENLLLLLLD